MSYDVSTLWPINNSVAEVATIDVPDGISSNGEWLYKNGKISPAPIEYLSVATRRLDSEMTAATLRITALTEAQDDDDITDAELTELLALREYRTALRRLDISTAPDINWPKSPV